MKVSEQLEKDFYPTDYEIFDTREGLKSSDNILLMIRK